MTRDCTDCVCILSCTECVGLSLYTGTCIYRHEELCDMCDCTDCVCILSCTVCGFVSIYRYMYLQT